MDVDHLEKAHQLVSELSRRTGLTPEISAWLDSNRRLLCRRSTVRVVFDVNAASGYIWAGLAGQAKAHQHPSHAGLDFAHRVFQLGSLAGAVLRADDLAPSPSAARNALARAAAWLDEAGEPEVARCVRSIGVTVRGAITYSEPPGVELVLQLP